MVLLGNLMAKPEPPCLSWSHGFDEHGGDRALYGAVGCTAGQNRRRWLHRDNECTSAAIQCTAVPPCRRSCCGTGCLTPRYDCGGVSGAAVLVSAAEVRSFLEA